MDSPVVVGLRIAGKIDEADMDRVIAAVSEKLDDTDERLRIYVELGDWSGISLPALFKDLRFGLPRLRRFAKKAVVTEKKWAATLADIADRLFSIEVRAFGPEQKDEALEWVSA